MEPDFSQKIRFSQNFGESAKNWPNIMFFLFFSKSCLSMYIFWLKLKQIHTVDNSVKTAYLGKICFSNYGPKWYYPIRYFKFEYLKIGLTDWAEFFLWWSKLIQRNTMNAEWFDVPARACACMHFSLRIFWLSFFFWILIDVYNL